MSIYQTIKENITTRQAAERYGLQVARNGMARCPFHDDHTPSLKVDERYHCFGCQVDGDVIDFTTRLFGVGNYQAAQRLAMDFAINVDDKSTSLSSRTVSTHNVSQWQHRQDEAYCLSALTRYERLLTRWKVECAPAHPTDPIDDRFTEACQMLPYITDLLDFLHMAEPEQRTSAVEMLMTEYKIEILNTHMDRLQKEAVSHDNYEACL